VSEDTVYVIADGNVPSSIFQRLSVPKHCVMRPETPEEGEQRKAQQAKADAYSQQIIDDLLVEHAVEKKAEEELRAQPWDIQCSRKEQILKLVQEYLADVEYYHSHDLLKADVLMAKYQAVTDDNSRRHRDLIKHAGPLEALAFLALLRKQHYERCPVDRNADLGTFNVISGKLRLSDPCYKMDTWCAGTLDNVKPGVWKAQVRHACDWGLRPFFVGAFHESYEGGIPLQKEEGWEKSDIHVGVDSGQAGIFDAILYRSDKDVTRLPAWVADVGDGEVWYAACCDATIDDKIGAGLVPGGVVSRSGHGDGGYSAYLKRNAQGEVIAVFIDFIGMMHEEEKE
jgi:hypothetical protein